MKKIIIIIPCYNEEDSLPHLIDALNAVRSDIKNYQVDFLLINDGSTDGTQNRIEWLSEKHAHIYFREFAHNAGHQSALRAGLNASVGYDAAVMLDADMQHPPELIPSMLKAWQDGVQIVQMIRKDSFREVGLFKNITSKSYYWLINRVSNLKLSDGESDFRLIDQAVTKTVAESREKDLFLRGYFSWLKVSKINIDYKPGKRIAGTSKYSLKKMASLAYKGILQFSEKPLQIAVSIGALLALLSFFYGVALIVRYYVGDHTVSGWTSLMVIMLFCFGVNFILLGIIGSYLAHSIYIEKQRPEFIVASEKIPGLV